MTRDQALAIINNIELIKHFANGGIVVIPINGHKHPTNTLVLSNFRSDRPVNYEIKKKHYRYSFSTKSLMEA
jgi:hypothetical protein